jgi:hypothetical protein
MHVTISPSARAAWRAFRARVYEARVERRRAECAAAGAFADARRAVEEELPPRDWARGQYQRSLGAAALIADPAMRAAAERTALVAFDSASKARLAALDAGLAPARRAYQAAVTAAAEAEADERSEALREFRAAVR